MPGCSRLEWTEWIGQTSGLEKLLPGCGQDAVDKMQWIRRGRPIGRDERDWTRQLDESIGLDWALDLVDDW